MKIFNRSLSILISGLLLCSFSPAFTLAQELGTAYVTIENTTYPQSEGAPWDGALLDMYAVKLQNNDKMMDVVLRAINDNDIEQGGAESNYIYEINGLDAFDTNGWMMTLNDWFTNEGAGSFYISDGDIIKLCYTRNWGEDIGSSWFNNNTELSSLTFSCSSIDFSPNLYNYTLTIPSSCTKLTVMPTAANKNFQTRIYKNAVISGSADDGWSINGESDYENMLCGLSPWTTLPYSLDFYKRNQNISVKDGDIITVACGLSYYNSMNQSDGGCVYNIKIKTEAAAFSVNESHDADKITLNITSPDEGELFFCLISEASDATLLIQRSTEAVNVGSNTIILNHSSFTKSDNESLLIWDKNMVPCTEKIKIK